ncbi:cytochrome c oxidase subunit Vc family protein [Striga asiatica]|uniref:Cytochrome c oxidase subunit Vc family protein n=1 Tax=Striga asiatica TaxID=4170 RepID=A0A5A7QRJ5_STRAF|nr:cytochrome c oxidase subunit Vc family protein [Striga asiatica]
MTISYDLTDRLPLSTDALVRRRSILIFFETLRSFEFLLLLFPEKMGGGHVVYKGPSIMKEILIGIGLGLAAGALWKRHHWNNQRRTKEFYEMLEKGEISVVREDE